MDRLLEVIIESRGEDNTDKTIEGIKKYYKVESLEKLSNYQVNVLLAKFESEIKKRDNADRPKCGECGEAVYRKGMFYICNKCHKVI